MSLEQEQPTISVIVTVYNRTQFVHEAIKSVIKQTLDRNLYEIIVISNIPVDISGYGKNVKLSLIQDEEIGKKYLKGLEISSGKIITFLDDDDLFYETRLEKIMDFYNRHDGPVYYHNSFSFVDLDGKDIKSSFKKFSLQFSNKGKPMFIKMDGKLRKLVKAKKFAADFNMSSTAVSREVITENSNLLFSSKKTPDLYLFLETIRQGIPIYLDPERLTKYRLRPDMQVKSLPNNIKTGHAQQDARDEIVSVALKSGNKIFLRYSYFEKYDYLSFSELRKFKNSQKRERRMAFDNLRKLPLTKIYLMPYFSKYLILYILLLFYPDLIIYLDI